MNLGVDSTYVINLKRHKLRKKRMDHLINKLQLENVNFIEAIDRKDYLDNSFEFARENFHTNFWDPNGWITIGILCCAMSHRKAWKKFLDSGDELGLFLEDDVKNTSAIHKLDFNQVRNDLIALNGDGKCNWGVAIYGRYYKHIIKGKKIAETFCNSFLYASQYSGHAYVLNKTSAQWFYDNTEKIKFAADIRLEISPFNVITLEESIFVQRHKDYQTHGDTINNNLEKYSFTNEFLHETTKECEDLLWDKVESWEEDKKLISKYVPVVKYENQKISFKGENIDGVKFTLGETNVGYDKNGYW